IDVDTSGISTSAVLKWNGVNWAPSGDIAFDSLSFALNGGHSVHADTAEYAFQSLYTSDSVSFSYSSDSSMFADTAGYSINSNHSVYSDTALYSLNCISTTGNWDLMGNSGTNPAINFIGSTNAADVVIKSDNAERIRIKSDGKIGIGTSNPAGALHIISNDALIHEGTFGSGAALGVSGAGTRMFWYPKKAAMRAGRALGAHWDDANIGNYSFAVGYDTRASGQYSFAGGQLAKATNDNAIAFGDNALASGVSSIAIGSATIASGYSAIALGRGSSASDSGAVALTYHGSAGRYAVAFGYYTKASGRNSVAMGTSASTNGYKGSFVFADITKQTTSPSTLSTADNQFMAKASGGFIFYTDMNTTMGVTLPAGGGSWASISDKNKKNNFRKVNTSDVLNKIATLEITTWNYKTQDPSIRHIGPMAQDFYALFGLGENETSISTVDIDGINMAAIQALIKVTGELEQKSSQIEILLKKLEEVKKEKDLLEKRITRAEALIEKK
ncbi:MAG TPA: tail fiber domain-containing protein, partial [Bacteroidia bacterium]